VDLGLELERELSPARYLREHREEFSGCAHEAIVAAGIEAALALEECNPGRARRQWRLVLQAARAVGSAARHDGLTPRRLASQVDRLRQAMETVLFDGFLPPDLAAWATRCVAKMCTRAVERALCAYWAGDGGAGDAWTGASFRPTTQAFPPLRGYRSEPRMRTVDWDLDART
jgi:hypothetical protein